MQAISLDAQIYLEQCLDSEVRRLSFDRDSNDSIYPIFYDWYINNHIPLSRYKDHPPFHHFILGYIKEKLRCQ